MKFRDVVKAWDEANPAAIHPLRAVSEKAYVESGRIQAKALARVAPEDSMVVDFGCGDGRVTGPLAEILGNNRVMGIDSSERMLKSLRGRYPHIATRRSDGSNLDTLLRPGVGLLFCLAVLIHHDWAGGKALVTNMAKAVKPGGLLVLNWPTDSKPQERAHWIDVTTWDRQAKADLAESLGLKRVDVGLPEWTTYEVAR